MKISLWKSNAIRIERDDCELVIAVYLFFVYIVYVFNNTMRHFIGNTHKMDTLFLYGLFALLCLWVIREMLSRIKLWQLLISIAVLIVLLISLLFSSQPDVNIVVIKEIMILCLPAFLMAGTVRDFSKLKRYITTAAIITPYAIAFTIYALGVSLLGEGESYSQSMSYFLLLPAIILAGALLERISIKTLIPFLVSCFIIFSYGARGPVFSIALFVILKLLLTISMRNWKKGMMIIILTAVLGLLFYFSFYEILKWLQGVFNTLGLSIRATQSIMDASFFEDYARKEIYVCCLERIYANPLWGTGIVNDRIYIANALNFGIGAIGYYPHNIFIELLLQFGLFVGIVLCVLLVALIGKSLSKRIPTGTKSIVLILLGSGLFPLLISGSYISSSDFYFLMGICGAINFASQARLKPIRKDTNKGLSNNLIS